MSIYPSQDNLYTTEYAEIYGCQHKYIVDFGDHKFCQHCGILHCPDIKVYKSQKMKFGVFINPIEVMKFLMQPFLKYNIHNDNVEYSEQRNDIIECLIKASQILPISIGVVFLSMHYLDTLFSYPQSKIPLILYASTSLMLAAKVGEIDQNIPIISKIKKVVSLSNPEILSYKTLDFRLAEIKLLKQLDWKLNQPTLIDRVEFLLGLGVIYDDDELIEETEKVKFKDIKDINKHLQQIDSNYKDLCIKILKGINYIIFYQRSYHSIIRLIYYIFIIDSLSSIVYRNIELLVQSSITYNQQGRKLNI